MAEKFENKNEGLRPGGWRDESRGLSHDEMDERMHGKLISYEAWVERHRHDFSAEEIKTAFDRFEHINPSSVRREGGRIMLRDGFPVKFELEIVKDRRLLREKIESTDEETGRIYQNIPVNSFGSPAGIKLTKIAFAEGIKQKLKNAQEKGAEKIIYFASSDDLETAMLTEVPEIILVDPALSKDIKEKILNRVKSFYDKGAIYDEVKSTIKFDFRDVHYLITMCDESMEEFNQNKKTQADVVMLFNKGPGMEREEAEKALARKEFYFDNR